MVYRDTQNLGQRGKKKVLMAGHKFNSEHPAAKEINVKIHNFHKDYGNCETQVQLRRAAPWYWNVNSIFTMTFTMGGHRK